MKNTCKVFIYIDIETSEVDETVKSESSPQNGLEDWNGPLS
jgi:hypothetical protein